MIYLLLILSFIGILDSIYLTYQHLTEINACGDNGGRPGRRTGAHADYEPWQAE